MLSVNSSTVKYIKATDSVQLTFLENVKLELSFFLEYLGIFKKPSYRSDDRYDVYSIEKSFPVGDVSTDHLSLVNKSVDGSSVIDFSISDLRKEVGQIHHKSLFSKSGFFELRLVNSLYSDGKLNISIGEYYVLKIGSGDFLIKAISVNGDILEYFEYSNGEILFVYLPEKKHTDLYMLKDVNNDEFLSLVSGETSYYNDESCYFKNKAGGRGVFSRNEKLGISSSEIKEESDSTLLKLAVASAIVSSLDDSGVQDDDCKLNSSSRDHWESSSSCESYSSSDYGSSDFGGCD